MKATVAWSLCRHSRVAGAAQHSSCRLGRTSSCRAATTWSAVSEENRLGAVVAAAALIRHHRSRNLSTQTIWQPSFEIAKPPPTPSIVRGEAIFPRHEPGGAGRHDCAATERFAPSKSERVSSLCQRDERIVLTANTGATSLPPVAWNLIVTFCLPRVISAGSGYSTSKNRDTLLCANA